MKYSTLCLGLGLLLTGFLPSCQQDTAKGPELSQVNEDQRKILALLQQLQAPQAKTIEFPGGARSITTAPNSDIPYTEDDGTPVEVEGEDTKPMVEPGEENGIPGEYVTSTRWYNLTQTFDEAMLLNPQADIAYAGCLLNGSTLTTGEYGILAGVDTEPMTISISTTPQDPADIETISYEKVNLRMSDYRKALAKWYNVPQKSGSVSTLYNLSVYTKEWDLHNALGVTVGLPNILDIKASLGLNHQSKKNVIVGKFLQRTYSVTMDFPKMATIINKYTSDLPTIIGKTRPVYVSNVTYGRIVLVSIETSESLSDVQAALDFLLKGKKIDVAINNTFDYKRVLTNTKVNLMMIGGSAEAHSNVIKDLTLEQIKEYLAAPLAMEHAEPISLQMRYVHDNGLARMVTQLHYPITERTFIPNFSKLTIQVEATGFSTRGGQFGASNIWGNGFVQVAGMPELQFDKVFDIPENHQIKIVSDGTRQPFPSGSGAITFAITKPADMSIQDFLKLRIEFNARMHEQWMVKKHDYPQAVYGLTIGDLLARINKGDDEIVVTGQDKKREVRAFFKVSKPTYERVQAKPNR